MNRTAPPRLLVRDLEARTAGVERNTGSQIRDRRLELGISQARLASCAGVDQGHLSRIEAGRAHPTIRTLVALATCLGSDLGVRIFPTSQPRLQDRFQAPMVEAMISKLGPLWQPRPEVPIPAARGVIDLLLTRRLDRLVICCECHSELRRLELVLRRAHEKTEALRKQHVDDASASVSTLLLLRSTRA